MEWSFKCHLTNKIDRCVGGSVVQQSCIGPYSLPLSNYAITRTSPISIGGILTAIGENIYIGQSISIWIDKTICELCCNLIGVPNLSFSLIKCSGNWMLNAKSIVCLNILYYGVKHLVNRFQQLQLGIDGGKDSLTMSMKTPTQGTITSPPSLVLTSYSLIQEIDILNRISPLINHNYKHSKLYYIDFLQLLQTDFTTFILEFNNIQSLISSGNILAIHDGSNIMNILEEMAVASGVGLIITKSNLPLDDCIFKHHYCVLQLKDKAFEDFEISRNWHFIAKLEPTNNEYTISYQETNEFKSLESIFNQRMKYSLELDTCVFPYKIHYKPYLYLWSNITQSTISKLLNIGTRETEISSQTEILLQKHFKIAIIRDEGSNSHREMASAFLQFNNVMCYDFTMNQLINSKLAQEELLECRGVVFVGGFSYGDVLASGRATAMIMKKRLSFLWEPIFQDSSKFILGVCNGCQILIEYGLLGDKVSMAKNISNKFECRWLPVNYKTPFTKTKTTLGIWVAHGEGRFMLTPGWQDTLEPIGFYTNSNYPNNPNGSDNNIIGLKSKYANHYVIMPHPERSLFKWQCEWIPDNESKKIEGIYTPWIEFFYSLIKIIK